MANEKIVNRENLKAFREKYDERLTSGQLVVSKSLTAKELETVSPESGDTQETPFALQGTGTANGTSSVDTGTVGKHIQKQGSVYCVNQVLQNGDFATDSGWNTSNSSISVSSNVATFTATAQNGAITHNITVVNNHIYLFKASIKLTTATTSVYLRALGTNRIATTATTNWQSLTTIFTNTYEGTSACGVRDERSSDWDAIQVSNVQLIDLTQWFNGNIPQDLLDHPEHWSWYQTYGDYISYNTGTLVAGNGRYLVCGGRNVWDEQAEQGQYSATTGEKTSGNGIRSVNAIRIKPDTNYYAYGSSTYNLYVCYYDANGGFIERIQTTTNQIFRTPKNAFFMNFNTASAYGNTYNHDITISIYYAGEDYSQYYPYEQPKVYDTGTETLLSTGVKLSVSGEREDIYDYKEPNGLITRRVGTRAYQSGDESDSSVITDGTTTYYALTTPTTEQGTPFSENIEIDDFGTMGWYSTYTDANTNALVDVPQGCKIFYPAWYIGFIDTLGQRADIDWNANNVVSQSELGVIDTKHDNLYAIMQENVGGALRHQIESLYTVAFENTGWLDLGNQTWTRSTPSGGQANFYSQTINDLKKPANNSTNAKIMCPLYKRGYVSDLIYGNKEDMTIAISQDGYIVVSNSSYTDATAFKNAMKGILLAYEKA